MSPEATAGFDPVDLAVLSSRFTAIVRSMSNTLIRTGRSVILNTGRDFSCCVVTGRDEFLAMAESIPVHVLSGPDLMAASFGGAGSLRAHRRGRPLLSNRERVAAT